MFEGAYVCKGYKKVMNTYIYGFEGAHAWEGGGWLPIVDPMGRDGGRGVNRGTLLVMETAKWIKRKACNISILCVANKYISQALYSHKHEKNLSLSIDA